MLLYLLLAWYESVRAPSAVPPSRQAWPHAVHAACMLCCVLTVPDADMDGSVYGTLASWPSVLRYWRCSVGPQCLCHAVVPLLGRP